MMAILTIARLTLRESMRRRLLLALGIATVVMAFITGWVLHKLVTLPCGGTGNHHACAHATITLMSATLLILLAFMFSFILALGAAFVAAPSIAGDVESGVLLSIATRPIRRSDVVLGKWLGLSLLLAVYGAGTATIEFIIMKIATGYAPPHPVLAIVCIVGEGIVVLTLALLASTRIPSMTGGVIALILFGSSWLGGIAGGVGAAFHNQAIENVGTVTSLILPTDGLWRDAIYNLQPAAIAAVESAAGAVASGNPFLVSAPPPTAYNVWAVLWIVGILSLAVWSFQRREL
jgi:ABC-type transport system involved in multi-copper enzyme maturation permease subunit